MNDIGYEKPSSGMTIPDFRAKVAANTSKEHCQMKCSGTVLKIQIAL